MSRDATDLESLAADIATELAKPGAEQTGKPGFSPRGYFLELLVMAMGGLYAKLPLGSGLFDRASLKSVMADLDDTDAGKLQTGTEDWIRLEGLVRALEGQKSYTLNRPSLAVLSTATAHGSVGELMERLQRAYVAGPPSPELRAVARRLGSYFMVRLGRS